MKELSDSMCPDVVSILFSFVPNQGSSKKKKAHLAMLPEGAGLKNTFKRSGQALAFNLVRMLTQRGQIRVELKRAGF